MVDNESSDALFVSAALGRLDKLNADEYIIALGPNGRQFFGTPNGYSAYVVSSTIIIATNHNQHPASRRSVELFDLNACPQDHMGFVRLHPDSWFFAFEMTDDAATFKVGGGIPLTLRQFLDRVDRVADLHSTLRVQLGSNGSFVAWAKTSWQCSGVPSASDARLRQLSSSYMSNKVTRGSLRSTLSQVAWHDDGSYYVGSWTDQFWYFGSSVTSEAWMRLWSGRTAPPSPKELSELVFVALDSHAPVADAFAFFMKQHGAEEAPFIIRFHGDTTHSSETFDTAPPINDTCLQRTERKPEKREFFRWAVCKRGGRPHPSDSWELEVERNQKVKVVDDKGGNWYIVEGDRGIRGWVHGTWLTFCGNKKHQDPHSTYAQFQEDMRKALIPGQLREFPPLGDYMSVCSNPACESMKGNSQLGICVHDLQTLLEGSGRYCWEWLKEERNVWHPDKFARYCQVDHKERLRPSAQEVFVLYGVLMDMCTRQEEEYQNEE